jgi:SAM-dependent methyltransferase
MATPPASPRLRLYDELAAWWPLLSPPDEYEEEATFYASTLIRACARPPRTVLELGSGGGCNASHMKAQFEMVLVEPSAGMREVSLALNPECEHVDGDMRTVRLDRQFDAVFVHDAVCYMLTEADLGRAIETARVHCRPGGVVLLAPDHVRETFEPATSSGGRDGEGRALRYLEWTWDPDPSDTTYLVDYALLLRTENGAARVEHDRHVEGLFPRELWLRLLTDAGFGPESIPCPHTGIDYVPEVFVARRRSPSSPARPAAT